jgi:cell division protein FtsA
MAGEPMVTGVDIGTYLTKVVVLKQQRDDIPPSVIALGTSFTEGMRKGVVIDEEDVAQSITRAVHEAQDMLDEPIEEAYVSFGGSHISAHTRREKIAVSRADGEVSPDDVQRLKEHVSRHKSSMNKNILDVKEKSYMLDDTSDIHDPVGMHGIRLELEGLLIEGDESALKTHQNALEKSGLSVAEKHVSVFATAEAVLTKKQRELGVVLVDIGASTTSLVVYEERTVIHLAVIPIGASHITNDLAIGLKTSIEIAERVKIKYGYVSPDHIPSSATNRIQLSEFNQEETASFPIEFVAEVIEARVQEIFQFVNQELAGVEREGLLPAGAVLTGGGANIRDIVPLAKSELDLPAQVGQPTKLEGNLAEVQDPLFATCVGLAQYGMLHEGPPRGNGGPSWWENVLSPLSGLMGGSGKRLKGWFDNIFPE